MMIRAIAIAFLTSCACILAAACDAAGNGTFDLAAKLPYFKMDDEAAFSALVRLGYEQGFLVCAEDPGNRQGSRQTARRFSLELYDASIEAIIEAILGQEEEYSWNVNDGVLNLINKELQQRDNIFDATIQGFRFEGGPEEFLSKVNQMVPGLAASRFRMIWRQDPEVELEILGPTSLREAFNDFARASRMQWHAYVPEGPMTVTIATPDDPTPVGVADGLWVNVQFIRVDSDIPGNSKP